jgi:uncharacterized membrane protein (TIGR02234 family)
VTRERRELAVAVLVTLLGSVLLLFAAGRPWAHAVVRGVGPTVSRTNLSGRGIAPLPAALGLAGLAASVALIAARGRWRIVVGVLVALIGAGAVGGAATVSRGTVRTSSALVDKVPTAGLHDASVAITLTSWRHLAAVGGLLLVGSGLLVSARGRRWATMGRKYDAPTATPVVTTPAAGDVAGDADVLRDSELWDRLDAGEDPTV